MCPTEVHGLIKQLSVKDFNEGSSRSKTTRAIPVEFSRGLSEPMIHSKFRFCLPPSASLDKAEAEAFVLPLPANHCYVVAFIHVSFTANLTMLLIQDATKVRMQISYGSKLQHHSNNREPAMAILCPGSPVTTVIASIAGYCLSY